MNSSSIFNEYSRNELIFKYLSKRKTLYQYYHIKRFEEC